MYVTNLTRGSVLLPNGRDLVTWLEVSNEELEALKKYEGTLLSISSTKPKDSKEAPKSLPIEDPVEAIGSTSLSDLMKPEPVSVEVPEDAEVKEEKKPTKKSGK